MSQPILHVGIGKSTNRSAEEAGREAASQALKELGGEGADLLLSFGTGGYRQTALLAGIRGVSGEVPLAGCSTSGVIAQKDIDESTHAIAVLALASDRIRFDTFQVRGLSRDSRACAKELGSQIRERSGGSGLLLVFPDGITGNITQFIQALQLELPSGIIVAGGTAGSLLKLEQTWQYHNGEVSSDTVSAVLIAGDFEPEIVVSHGCDPIGEEQTVTRAEKGWIYEIDGQPAWQVYKKYVEYGENHDLSMGDTCFLCLAEQLAEPDPDYGPYIIRCPLQLDKEKEALFFPGEIKNGTKVRMALRNVDKLIARANQSAESVAARHPGVTPALVLQFDCCCRGKLLFGPDARKLSLEPLQRPFGQEVPWFGFATYGEIAPLRPNRFFFHNYTTVLCALYAKD